MIDDGLKRDLQDALARKFDEIAAVVGAVLGYGGLSDLDDPALELLDADVAAVIDLPEPDPFAPLSPLRQLIAEFKALEDQVRGSAERPCSVERVLSSIAADHVTALADELARAGEGDGYQLGVLDAELCAAALRKLSAGKYEVVENVA